MQTLSFPRFVALETHPRLVEALEFADNIGCVLHYVPFALESAPDANSHGHRALEAMKRIVAFYAHRAQNLSSAEHPIEQFWRVKFDSEKLRGEPVGAAQFWGNDDVFLKPAGNGAFIGELIDGYKGAFFNPPMGISLPIPQLSALFDQINSQLWNDDLSDCAIYNWSNNWSNYFDAGHEGWGAYWWTIYSPQTRLLTVIGASASD